MSSSKFKEHVSFHNRKDFIDYAFKSEISKIIVPFSEIFTLRRVFIPHENNEKFKKILVEEFLS